MSAALLDYAPRTGDWRELALCAGVDSELFFPEKGGNVTVARRLCRSCDVRAQCLDFAVAHVIRFGIWGGLSERERRPLYPVGGGAA